MTFKTSLALGALTSIALAGTAFAQAAAPAAAPAAPAASLPQGPVIPGVCTYNNDRAIVASAVGQSMVTRLKQLAQSADAELNTERQALEAEHAQIDAAKATTPQDQLEQRELTFNQRVAGFERKVQQRSQEMEATKQKQVERIAEQLGPIVQQVYVERNCGLLLNGNAVFGANPQMDVTQTVITKLNAKITTITFDRERLDQQPGVSRAAPPAAGPAAAPAAAKPAPKKK